MDVPARPAAPCRQILKEVFGFEAFRPGQERAMDVVLNGGNALFGSQLTLWALATGTAPASALGSSE